MNEDIRYFYMWVHPYTQKTCYGVTDTLSRRKRNYQGHNGFDITWNFIARGSSDDIEKLEKHTGPPPLSFRGHGIFVPS